MCYVEREAYAAAALVARMADEALDQAPIWDDLATFDGRPWRGVVDIVTAGYPCQPFSQAGRRRGASDARHLWPHVRRVINQVRSRFVFLENVPGHLTLGYPVVRGQLEALGYRVAEGIYSAAEVGGSQLRKRLFVLACRDCVRSLEGEQHLQAGESLSYRRDQAVANDAGGRQHIRFANQGYQTGAKPHHRDKAVAGGDCEGLSRSSLTRGAETAGNGQQTGRPACGVLGPPLAGEGLPLFAARPADYAGWLDLLSKEPEALPAVRRDADGLAARVDRLRAAGNGVVPLAAAFAFVSLAARLGFVI